MIKVLGINILFLVNNRFREIEVQVSKTQSEITYNIFRKLKSTKYFRNIIFIIATIFQIVMGAFMIKDYHEKS